MQIASVQYSPVKDPTIELLLSRPVETVVRSRKIELIFAALSSLSDPFIRKDILNSSTFIESCTLIERLSPSGKISLARALLDQIA